MTCSFELITLDHGEPLSRVVEEWFHFSFEILKNLFSDTVAIFMKDLREKFITLRSRRCRHSSIIHAERVKQPPIKSYAAFLGRPLCVNGPISKIT